MAQKKRRPRSRPSEVVRDAPRGGANLQRRDRKDEARRIREAERRRARRASLLRRAAAWIGITVLAVGGLALIQSFRGPNDIPVTAVRAAEDAGCSDIEKRPDITPSRQHLGPGQTTTYPDPPATSGQHSPGSLPDEPKVYDAPVEEIGAVHSMEHGAVFIYYLPEASGGIGQDVVDRLATIAEGSEATFMAPYPDLKPEMALTLTAWNYRQSCPAGSPESGVRLTPRSAATIVDGFVTGFGCTGEAPENGAPPC